MDTEERREIDRLSSDINNVGSKVDRIDKDEAGCRAEMKSEIRAGEKRMDSHRDGISKIDKEIVEMRKDISDLVNMDGRQEEHLRSADSNIDKLTRAIDTVTGKVDTLIKTGAKNQGGLAVVCVLIGILEAVALHFWK